MFGRIRTTTPPREVGAFQRFICILLTCALAFLGTPLAGVGTAYAGDGQLAAASVDGGGIDLGLELSLTADGENLTVTAPEGQPVTVPDYASFQDAPWYADCVAGSGWEDVMEVAFSGGFAHIGHNAFACDGFGPLTVVKLPAGCTYEADSFGKAKVEGGVLISDGDEEPDDPNSGTFNDADRVANALRWSVSDDGVLTVDKAIESSSGKVSIGSVSDAPWKDVASNITSLKIGSGITSWTGQTFANTGWGSVVPATLKSIDFSDATSLETLSEFIFNGQTQLTELDMSTCTSLKTLEDGDTGAVGPFINCSNIATVKLPDTVETIGGKCFSGCTSLASINIPSSLKALGSQAFNRVRVESFDFSNTSITEVKASAFMSNSALTSISLPDTVEPIATAAFQGCSRLASIELPKSLASLDATKTSAFTGCSSLANITVAEGNTAFVVENGLLMDAAKTTVYRALANTEVIQLPPTLTAAGISAFGSTGQAGLVRFVGEGLDLDGAVVEEMANTYRSIHAPQAVDAHGSSAEYFAQVKTIWGDGPTYTNTAHELDKDSEATTTTVVTAPTCTATGENLLAGPCFICGETVTETVAVPALGHEWHETVPAVAATCTEAGTAAIETCSRCGTTRGGEAIAALGHEWGEWAVVRKATTEEVGLEQRVCAHDATHVETSEIPKLKATVGTEVVTSTGDEVVVTSTSAKTVSYEGTAGAAAKTATIPSTVTVGGVTYKVTSVAAKAFANSKALTKVTVPKTVTTIGAGAFANCAKLTKATVKGNALKTVEANAFSGCTKLKSVALSSTSLKSIGAKVLKGTKVTTLSISSKKLTKSSVKNALKGSSVKVVKVPKAKVAAYKKVFTEANCGKKVTVKAL